MVDNKLSLTIRDVSY